MRIRLARRLGALSVLLLIAACSGGGDRAPTAREAWVRPSTVAGEPVAAYLIIDNTGGESDRLLGVSSPSAASVEIHETSTDMDGMTGMHPIDGIDVPAGGSVPFEPGGYHLMLVGLAEPLEVGDTIELRLVFRRAGPVDVIADVRSS